MMFLLHLPRFTAAQHSPTTLVQLAQILLVQIPPPNQIGSTLPIAPCNGHSLQVRSQYPSSWSVQPIELATSMLGDCMSQMQKTGPLRCKTPLLPLVHHHIGTKPFISLKASIVHQCFPWRLSSSSLGSPVLQPRDHRCKMSTEACAGITYLITIYLLTGAWGQGRMHRLPAIQEAEAHSLKHHKTCKFYKNEIKISDQDKMDS